MVAPLTISDSDSESFEYMIRDTPENLVCPAVLKTFQDHRLINDKLQE